MEIWLVNVAESCGRAARNQWCCPVGIFITKRARTIRMNMDRDRTDGKTKIPLQKRPRNSSGVPTIVKCAVAHRITVGKSRWRVFVHDWNPDLAHLFLDLGHPFVAFLQSA